MLRTTFNHLSKRSRSQLLLKHDLKLLHSEFYVPGHIIYKGKLNSLQLYMILTHSMIVCHAQHLATNSQGQVPNFGEKSTLSEYGHVEYQIKGNEMYDNTQANILPLHTPSTPGLGQKIKTLFLPSSSTSWVGCRGV